MLLMTFKNVANGPKIDSFKYFLKDFDETIEQREKGPKLAHLLMKNQHSFGEFSDEPIKLHRLKKFEKVAQKNYDLTMQMKKEVHHQHDNEHT